MLFDIKDEVMKMGFLYRFNSARRLKEQFETNFLKLVKDL
jgi:hypothetical protein